MSKIISRGFSFPVEREVFSCQKYTQNSTFNQKFTVIFFFEQEFCLSNKTGILCLQGTKLQQYQQEVQVNLIILCILIINLKNQQLEVRVCSLSGKYYKSYVYEEASTMQLHMKSRVLYYRRPLMKVCCFSGFCDVMYT